VETRDGCKGYQLWLRNLMSYFDILRLWIILHIIGQLKAEYLNIIPMPFTQGHIHHKLYITKKPLL
jgi:hypothetical protein